MSHADKVLALASSPPFGGSELRNIRTSLGLDPCDLTRIAGVPGDRVLAVEAGAPDGRDAVEAALRTHIIRRGPRVTNRRYRPREP